MLLQRVVATRSFWVVLVALMAFGLSYVMRDGYFQRAADQFALDAAMQFEARNQADEAVAPIVLVKVSNADISRYGWPLRRDALTPLLAKLLAAKPAVVGFLSPINNQMVLETPNLADPRVVVGALGGDLDDSGLDNVYPLDVQVDVDGVVRRVQMLQTGARESQSIVAELALRWADNAGVPFAVSKQSFRVGNTRIARLDSDYADTSYHSWQALPYYSGTSRNLPTVTVSELLDNADLQIKMAGRIVLLGNMSEAYAARYPTPLARNILDDYGVLTYPEIMSEQLSAILGVNTFGRTSYTSVSDQYVTIGLAAIAVLLAGLYLLVETARRQLIVFLSAAALLIIGWVVGYGLGWFLPIAVPLLLIISQYIAQLIALASVEYTNRRALGNMLSRHLSSQVAQELWKKRYQVSASGSVPTAKTTATVLFADVVGFTQLSENLEPEELVAWLNRMLTEVTKSVSSHHGIVDKFIGDAVMAVFGVPDFAQNEKQLRRQADNAIKAALSIRERLMALNGELAAQGLPVFQMRAGIHTGELVAGEIGSIDKSNYTVIGDTVNVASRIESKAGEYEAEGEAITIVMSAETRELTTLDAHFDELGVQQIKGRAQPVVMYRLNPSSGALIKDMVHSAPSSKQIEAAIGLMSQDNEVAASAAVESSDELVKEEERGLKGESPALEGSTTTQ